jgi:hypothetical protein
MKAILGRFSWRVCDDYYRWIGPRKDVLVPVSLEYEIYSPQPDLFLYFVELKGEKEDVGAFATLHGLLGIAAEGGESLESWKQEIAAMKQAMSLSDKKDWSGLANEINSKLRDYLAPQIVSPFPTANLEIELTPKNLLGQMWMQLALYLSSGARHGPCRVCKKTTMIVTVGNRQERRTCGNACRTSYSRLRRSCRKKQISLQQFAERLRIDLETARTWMAED